MASVDQNYYSPKSRKKVLSLVEIATNRCIQNVAKLEDVGATPFHLLVPVLRRMNAKQLGQIEELSPQITPESDELWANLVSKEFPDRPLLVNNVRRSKNSSKLSNMVAAAAAGGPLLFCDMPMKSLYAKYSDERESFREDSAERLRKITQRLKKEKSANSIVSVPELLRDPTVRRQRHDGGSGYSPSYGPKNSILNKARKEIRNRSLMFPNYAQKVKKYDPYDAFKLKNSPCAQPGPAVSHSLHQPRPQPRLSRPTQQPSHTVVPKYIPRFNNDRSNNPKLGAPVVFNGQPIPHSINTSRSSGLVSRLNLRASSHSSVSGSSSSQSSSPQSASSPIHSSLSEPHSPHTSVSSPSLLPRAVSEAIKKRKPEPSIFLTGRRNKRPMRVPRAQMKGPAPSNDMSSHSLDKKITLIKSSIFN